MARNLAHHQPLPASLRRLTSDLEEAPAAQVADVARVAVRGRPNPAPDTPASAAFMLVPFGEWTEEDQEASYKSLSAAVNNPSGPTTATVAAAELQRLTNRAYEEMMPSAMPWFRRSSVYFTICNDDPKKSILVMNQRTGTYMIRKVMILDTGSMLFVMNPLLFTQLGLFTTLGKASIDPSLGSQGISPCASVNFDVLLPVDVLHAMSAGVLPATPRRDAALVFHPRNQQASSPRSRTTLHLHVTHRTHRLDAAALKPATHWGALFRVAWAAIAIASLLQPADGALMAAEGAHTGPTNAIPVAAILCDIFSIIVIRICSVATIRRRQIRHAQAVNQSEVAQDIVPADDAYARHRLPPAHQEINNSQISTDTVQNIFDTLSHTTRGPAKQENLRPVPARATTRPVRRTQRITWAESLRDYRHKRLPLLGRKPRCAACDSSRGD
ncbi:hypothetical protein CYMTET_54442 [Cymbomonas tetramitiformis]|uniref:Uncharacterized protein n=1 Tax=Cymbomonas tetramitiformis TaxID=36881 RepID=A0AAE0EQQ4_9CHLO|nr:hypothetical protein CYMTET_54442 [Cymbomonas tetramitiformis]